MIDEDNTNILHGKTLAWWGILLVLFDGEKRLFDRLKYTYVQKKKKEGKI